MNAEDFFNDFYSNLGNYISNKILNYSGVESPAVIGTAAMSALLTKAIGIAITINFPLDKILETVSKQYNLSKNKKLN